MAISKNYLSMDQEAVGRLFHDRHPDLKYYVEIGSNELTYGAMHKMMEDSKKSKKIRIVSIECLPSNIPYFNIGSGLSKDPKRKIEYVRTNDKTGLFVVTLSNGGEVIISSRLFRVSKEYFVQKLFCTDPATLKEFLKLFKAAKLKQTKPPVKGIYVTQHNQFGGIDYVSKKFPNPPVIHQQASVIEKSIETYFENKERYLRNGKSGTKRILMFGLPGGGKTTLCYQIARKYEKTHLVVFCSDIRSLAIHSMNCSRHKVPTIVFNEECDKWLGRDDSGTANTEVKSFLDGHLSARNKAGEIDILITNYPQKIERTILFRPGRIHERIEVGCLDEQHALRVAKFYFVDSKGNLLCDESELDFFKSTKYTGAQIENIAGLVIDYVNGTDQPITKQVISKVVNDFKEAVNTVKVYKDQTSLVDMDEHVVGFQPTSIVATNQDPE